MKWILRGLMGLVVISHANAAKLQISSKGLGVPFYRSVSKLSLHSLVPESGNLSVNFLDKSNRSLEIQENVKIKKGDWVPCSSGQCLYDIYELSMSLEKYSCSIDVKFTSPSGQVLLNTKESWGNCSPTPIIPDRKFLADFVFPESAYFSENSTIEIQNVGSNYFQKPLTIWGFLKDAEGKIIWSGSYSVLVNVNTNATHTVDFQNAPKAWQNHLACSGQLIIEPEFASFERSKLNNSIKIEYGNCEDVPSENRGDKIDFAPDGEVENGVLSLWAFNNGKLPYLEETTKLQTYIRYLDQDRKVIFTKNLFIGPTIYGFGDSKKVIQDTLPVGTCSVEIELNPNLTIRESNYINNRIELKVCE